MTPALIAAIDEAQREVSTSQDLSPRARKRILRELGPVEKDGRFARFGVGLRRRSKLCQLCVTRVIPIWEEEDDTRDAHHIVEVVDLYLDGTVSAAQLSRDTQALLSTLEDMTAPELRLVYCVGRAATQAGLVALFDERLIPSGTLTASEIDDPQDPDNYDCALWAAAAESAGFLGQPTFDAARCSMFWSWYLNTAVPAAYTLEG
jgi:hypothetical protein